MILSRKWFAVVLIFIGMAKQAEAVTFKSAACGAMLSVAGDTSRQSAISEIQQTLSAVESMSSFRQATEPSSASVSAKIKVKKQILEIENQFETTVDRQLTLFKDPSRSDIFSGLHLVGPEVNEFLSDLVKANQDFRAMTWKAKLNFYKRWYGLRVLKMLSPYVVLTALPFVLKAFHLDQIRNPITSVALAAAAVGGLYGGWNVGAWAIGPPVFLLAQPFTLDYKYSRSMESFGQLISAPSDTGWAFASAKEDVRPEFLNFWMGATDSQTPLDLQASFEAIPSSKNKLMPVEIAQLLTFQKDPTGNLVPVLDITLHIKK